MISLPSPSDGSTRLAVDESLSLATLLRADARLSAGLARMYFRLCLLLTRLMEKSGLIAAVQSPSQILNYGCGNVFYEGAINSDLFFPHRRLLGKRPADFYWSGMSTPAWLKQRLDGVVCEHVIEHMLPDDVLNLLRNFHVALRPHGKVVVSFPDVRRILAGERSEGFSSEGSSLNSLIYRHGHCFMYDASLVAELLRLAGFSKCWTGHHSDMPFAEFLHPSREEESTYVIAEKD